MDAPKGLFQYANLLRHICLGCLLITFAGLVNSHTDSPDSKDQFAIPEWATPVMPWPTVSKNVSNSIGALMRSESVKRALEFLREDDPKTLQQNIFLSEIPAPTFHEEKKTIAYLKLMKDSGLTDVRLDGVGNVIGVRKGVGKGPTVLIDAHIDTVFPLGTDIKVKKKDGVYYGPGITDDTRAMAANLSIIRALNAANVQTVGDLVFLASVGEEGLGNLRGIKEFFSTHKNIDAAIIVESIPMGVAGIVSTASKRYEVSYEAPGGHSYAEFGQTPSAIHAMGRAISKIADVQVPKFPRTTYNVGIVKGGRSINTISPDAVMEIDIRSDNAVELDKAVKKILDIVQQSALDENKKLGTNSLKVSIKLIGERVGGSTPADSVIVQSFLASLRANNEKELMLIGASTNAAIPISLGIPTIIVGPGGRFAGFHALTEAMDPTDAFKGAQVELITALSLVGVSGTSSPLLGSRLGK